MAAEQSESQRAKKLGVLIGGSGLIGGALTHYFKTKTGDDVDILAPNSKKLSLRVADDIKGYFRKYRPDFIINAAIASIDSDPLLAYETNYLGAVNLARVALALKVPYIHISSAAIMPVGEDLDEDNILELSADLSNYTKSKLMTELTLKHMGEAAGLDYTVIRLGVVYGKHDHKIQGFHRLLFAILDQDMPFLFTRKGVLHSYSNMKKVPHFIQHILERRPEFSRQTYNFVDRMPVDLSQLILTVKSYVELSLPKELYVPYPVALCLNVMTGRMVRMMRKIGIDAKTPAETQFLKNFYQTQTLSPAKLEASSFVDPAPGSTVFTEIPSLIEYYLTRWEHLNLISHYNKEFFDPQKRSEEFLRTPEILLESIKREGVEPFSDI